jgi:hypothetical protein
MSYAVQDQAQISTELNERLRMEVGWHDVGKGLTQVLFGYLTGFLGTAIGIGLVMLSLYGSGDNMSRARPSLGSLWQFYIGMGILSVVGLISYVFILGGQFKCMMGAAERNGARWFMFMCITSLIIGAAFHLASGVAGLRAYPDWRRGATTLQELQLTELGKVMQLAGFGVGLLYPLFFILFLRAIAACMNAYGYVKFINVYLVFAGALIAATAFMIYNPSYFTRHPTETLLLAGGWVVSMLTYVVSILLIRVCIYQTMERLRSPLDF